MILDRFRGDSQVAVVEAAPGLVIAKDLPLITGRGLVAS